MTKETLIDILDGVGSRDEAVRWRPTGSDRFESWSGAELVDAVDRCARGLAALGVADGDRVGVLCANRPHWHVVDFACHRLGAVLVPLFSTLTASQVAFAFGDAGCKVAVVDDTEQLGKVREALAELPAVETVVTIDPLANVPGLPGGRRQLSLEELGAEGDPGTELPGPRNADALATIIYTSGTTGPPKGVMLTHGNLVSNATAVVERIPCGPDDLGLSVLPLCHAYERTVDYAYFHAGVIIAYSSPREMAADLLTIRPTMIIGVPRLYEKIRDNVEERARGSGAVGRWLYERARAVGERRARSRFGGEPGRVFDALLHRVLDAIAGRRIRQGLGGRLRILSAGGAALDEHIAWWFLAFGMQILQGYGLTESSPIIACNALGANRIGSVGRALADVEIRIGADGEILTRGPHVMAGDWERHEATAEALEAGWLHTGDIGRIDDDGYLWITDRKKSLLVTSTGKKVAPTPIEGALSASPYIAQVMVLGDDRRFISALIVPAFDRLAEWAAAHGLSRDADSLIGEPKIHELIQNEIDRLQPDLARYERVREFRLVRKPFSAALGQLTPTLKLVRNRILDDYADLIEEIYEH